MYECSCWELSLYLWWVHIQVHCSCAAVGGLLVYWWIGYWSIQDPAISVYEDCHLAGMLSECRWRGRLGSCLWYERQQASILLHNRDIRVDRLDWVDRGSHWRGPPRCLHRWVDLSEQRGWWWCLQSRFAIDSLSTRYWNRDRLCWSYISWGGMQWRYWVGNNRLLWCQRYSCTAVLRSKYTIRLVQIDCWQMDRADSDYWTVDRGDWPRSKPALQPQESKHFAIGLRPTNTRVFPRDSRNVIHAR